MSREQELQDWNRLNPRQKHYLELIYRADQAAEHEENQRWFVGQSRRPASVWRWLYYGDIAPNQESSLKKKLQKAGLVDPGTGSTFKALKRRNFIDCRWSMPPRGSEGAVDIQLTRKGRGVARAGLNEPVKHHIKAPRGMLSEKGWMAMSLVSTAEPSEISADSWYYYGGIHLNVWEDLERKELITVSDQRVCATLKGYKFYLDYYDNYCALYPHLNSPIPILSEEEIQQRLEDLAKCPETRFKVMRTNRDLRAIAAEIDPTKLVVTASTLSRFEHGKSVRDDQLRLILSWLDNT